MIHIYAYQNKINGKVYIGQTIDLHKRDISHKNRRDNIPIENAIKKYGRNNFDLWTISIKDTQEDADQEEIYWIAEMRKQLGKKMVYNIANGGGGVMTGRKHSEATKKKISEKTKGHSRNKGVPRSEQAKKNSAAGVKLFYLLNDSPLKGISKSEATKKKMSDAKKNTPLTKSQQEHLVKLHLSNIGKKPMLGKKHSQETKNQMSKSRTGRKHSQETKDKIGKASIGRIRTEETKKKMSEARKKYLQKRIENRLK